MRFLATPNQNAGAMVLGEIGPLWECFIESFLCQTMRNPDQSHPIHVESRVYSSNDPRTLSAGHLNCINLGPDDEIAHKVAQVLEYKLILIGVSLPLIASHDQGIVVAGGGCPCLNI
jgi:hypothetical protein